MIEGERWRVGSLGYRMGGSYTLTHTHAIFWDLKFSHLQIGESRDRLRRGKLNYSCVNYYSCVILDYSCILDITECSIQIQGCSQRPRLEPRV